MAPEILRGEEFGKTVDVYSYGLILWELYTRQSPFAKYQVWDEFVEAILVRKERPPLDPEMPDSLKYLISSCWSDDRNSRPLFPSILSQLDEVLVDLAINDPPASTFWKKHFVHPDPLRLEEVVGWSEFIRAVQVETEIKDIANKVSPLFPYLAVVGSDKRVSIHSFSNTVRWCGYFFVADRAEQVLSEVGMLTRESWFHGCIDQLETEYPFTLSLKQRHLRIKKTLDQQLQPLFYLPIFDPITGQTKDNAYPTVRELVKGVSKVLELTVACPKVSALDAYQSETSLQSSVYNLPNQRGKVASQQTLNFR
jgi:hypothetical protein